MGCQEVPDLELGDDAVTIFLNTQGTVDNISWELRELLKGIGKSLKEGREEGIGIGEKKRQNSVILNMLHRGLPEDLIAEVAEISIEGIRKIKEAM